MLFRSRTDDAERVGDIALTLRHLLGEDGQPLSVGGFGTAGLWLLLAGALCCEDGRLRLAVDVDGFATDRVEDYSRRLPIPGLLCSGGLPNAAALLAPCDLLLHHTGGVFDASWAESAYALYEGASLRVEKTRASNDALVDFLMGDE